MSPQAEQATSHDGAAAAPEREAPPPRSESDPELARLEDQWRRAAADLDNLRKRYARELERERQAERSKVVGVWLPVVDNLERAVAHGGQDSEAVIDGVRGILAQAVQVLDHLGYPRDDQKGVAFDPERHEIVGVVDHDEAPGTVVDVVRSGYGTGPQRLRPAAVVVSRAKE